jgi:predicted Zn-dependent peptidase
MSNARMTILPNGLKVVTDTAPSMESVAVGVWSDVGSRHEKPEINGVAHMVEHMMFKGTTSRNAQQIVEDIENVGGHMNAYTSREVTSYHIHLLAEDLPLAVDVLADMYQNSTLPEEELIKERQVILQEIGMCKDTPDDLVFDHYYETAYPDQAVGRTILGLPEIIAAMPRDALARHIQNFYTADRSVIVAAGAVDHDAFVRMIEDRFRLKKNGYDEAFEPAAYKGGDKRDNRKDLEQSHIVLGFDAPHRTSKDYYNVKVLSLLLGGGMSSRLFQEIRERRGLVYSVFSFYQAMQDSGQIGFYAGTGPEKIAELMPALCEELGKVQQNILKEEVDRTLTQLKSGMLMGRESMLNRADQQAKSVLYKGKVFDPAEEVEKMQTVSVESVLKAAQAVFSTTPTLAALGPLRHLESYESVKARL